eukprot:8358146-Alexandrium_andersonii.AAC.1
MSASLVGSEMCIGDSPNYSSGAKRLNYRRQNIKKLPVLWGLGAGSNALWPYQEVGQLYPGSRPNSLSVHSGRARQAI